MEPLHISGSLDGASPLRDGGMSLRFHTQEMSPAGKVQTMEYYQQFGQLLFAPEGRELTLDDLDKTEKAVEAYTTHKTKSESQRLRGAIHLLWVKEGSKGSSELFYVKYMEKFISHVRGKLE